MVGGVLSERPRLGQRVPRSGPSILCAASQELSSRARLFRSWFRRGGAVRESPSAKADWNGWAVADVSRDFVGQLERAG